MNPCSKETRNAIRVNGYFTFGNIPADAPRDIAHEPNKWFEETGDNVVSMIKRITHTSIQTARIIDTLTTPFTDGWTPR